MRVAAIDCGTNSVRLLVASLNDEGKMVDHDRRLELVRLGQGVDATGKFLPEALERAFATFGRYAEVIDSFGCEKVRLVATSAARDASNREEFFAGVRRILGVEAEIISGLEEAQLSFTGALSRLDISGEPILVTDIGGGSTELVVGKADGTILNEVSLDMGSVRVRERYLHSDPPTNEEITAATAFVESLLDESGIDFAAIQNWIGVAGTITSMSAINQGLTTYDPEKVHASWLTREVIEKISNDLLATTVAEILSHGLLQPRRAEVICAGGLIIQRLSKRVPRDLAVSESDILDGIALGMLKA